MAELRDLPGIESLMQHTALAATIARFGGVLAKEHLRAIQQEIRKTGTMPDWAAEAAGYNAPLNERLAAFAYTPVFNLTGTVIHTNLGRALLDETLWRQLEPLVTRPVNLEYDLATGRRGSRDTLVEAKLCALTGAEAACVVNNGAAALLLVLNTFALGRPVPVSRGELIEIGGSFRLPDIMARAGCVLREVGTTNRTHSADFAAEIEDAAMLLKIHPSNYAITGFTTAVGVPEMARLAAPHNLPVCVDLGSGSLVDLSRFDLPHEPTPGDVLREGASLVTFSGDKLMGGVQAGIIVGNKEQIAALQSNPLKRALRVDKITLAAMDATLRLFDDPDQLTQRLPLLRTLTTPLTELETRATAVARVLQNQMPNCSTNVVDCQSQIGSGTLPDQPIASKAVVVRGNNLSLEDLASRLRQLPTPVVGRINDNALWLDMRGAERLDELIENLATLQWGQP